jgi:DNA adenine methylase
MYIDPPYYDGGEDGNKLFKPLYPNCNFPIHHRGFHHEALKDLLYKHSGGFLLSYNDCPTIRKWYPTPTYKQEFPKWHYSYAQGETRLGKNRVGEKVDGLDKEQRKELLFKNVDETDQAKKLKKTLKKESHEILVINT